MIEILRVLAEGTGTSPRRLAVVPVARSLRYQLTWNSALSHSSLRLFIRSRIGRLLSFRPARYHGRAGPRLDLPARPGESTRDDHNPADPRHDDCHRRRLRVD